MAGSWIKMRTNLWDDPRVSRLCDLTNSSEAAIVGGLYWLWATADEHTEDGQLPGLTLRGIDRKTGIPGFGMSLCEIGWLEEADDGIRIPDFEVHNGASAKKRCQTAKRVAKFAAENAKKTPSSESANAQSVSGALPRERERRKEEEQTPVPLQASKVQGQEVAPPSAPPEPPDAAASARACKPDPKGTRLPDDWQLSKSLGEWAIGAAAEEGLLLTPERVRAIADQFRDHYRAKTGKDGRAADWAAKWRTWVRNELKFHGKDLPPLSAPAPQAQQSASWLDSASGIEARGAELGLLRGERELFPLFKARVIEADAAAREVAHG